VPQRRISRAHVGFLTGVPLAWAVLLLFHPTGDGEDVYPVVSDELTGWLVVHVGTLVFVPLMAVVVHLLLRGVDGGAARLARLALVAFVLFYAAWETLIGIGTGLFVDQVEGMTGAEQAGGARAVERYVDSDAIRAFELAGMVSLFTALTAAGIALRTRAGAPLAVPVLLVLAAVPIGWHVPPFGQFGLALFFVAVLLVVRGRASAQLP